MDIARELFEEPVVVGLECLAKGLVLCSALLQQNEKATELRSSAGLSPHQVVHESPGFRVEEALPRLLVVLGRILANRKQFWKRQQRLVAQAQNVTLHGKADARLTLGCEKGAVELGQSLVVPGGLQRKVAVKEVMQIFVEDDRARIAVPVCR